MAVTWIQKNHKTTIKNQITHMKTLVREGSLAGWFYSSKRNVSQCVDEVPWPVKRGLSWVTSLGAIACWMPTQLTLHTEFIHRKSSCNSMPEGVQRCRKVTECNQEENQQDRRIWSAKWGGSSFWFAILHMKVLLTLFSSICWIS